MSDRRFGKRLELDATIELVGAPGAASPPLLGRVVNLSGTGALATFRHGLRLGADGLAGRVTFGAFSTAVAPLRPVRIEPAAGDGGAFGVGVRFDDPTGRVLGDVAEILCAAQPAPVPLGSWDALVVAERDRLVPIRPESFPAIALRGRGRVFTLLGPNGNGGPVQLLLRVAPGGSGGRIEALPADQGRPPPASGASSVLVWTALRSVILVRAVLRPGGWPAEVVVLDAFLLRRRSHDRVTLGPRAAALVRIRHPLVAGLHVSRRVRNVGEEGLCIETDVRADVLSPGLHLPEILVALPDGAEVALSGTVASIRTGPGGGALCGICIEGAPAPEAWDRFVLGRIAPDVRDIAPDDMDAVWDLFDRTGYL
ncbi:MAG: hypothetical protein QME96_12680, partial [Myxococcota bacterium]|nr:hypothetical protein [Myxococcota bacterium]